MTAGHRKHHNHTVRLFFDLHVGIWVQVTTLYQCQWDMLKHSCSQAYIITHLSLLVTYDILESFHGRLPELPVHPKIKVLINR
jgi:hypothetical protein